MKALAVSVLAVALLAGCGGGSSTAQPAGSIKVSMTEWKFDPGTDTSITAPAGRVVFYVVNASSNTSHDMIIRNNAGTRVAGSDLISAGDTSVFTVTNIAAGTYTIFCDQPGHESSGMKGTLTITG